MGNKKYHNDMNTFTSSIHIQSNKGREPPTSTSTTQTKQNNTNEKDKSNQSNHSTLPNSQNSIPAIHEKRTKVRKCRANLCLRNVQGMYVLFDKNVPIGALAESILEGRSRRIFCIFVFFYFHSVHFFG